MISHPRLVILARGRSQSIETDLTVVDQRAAPFGEGVLGALLANVRAGLALEIAFSTLFTVEMPLGQEELGRVQIDGGLGAAPDIANGRACREDERDEGQRELEPRLIAHSQGNTS